MATVSRVLVVGGGIGGLTAGVALRQQEIAVDLIEINPNLNVYGVGIIQPNNTLRALDRIGLARECIKLGTPFPGWRLFDANGEFLMDAPNASMAAPDYPPNNGITRPNFHKVLSEAAYAQGVNIKLDTAITQMAELDEAMHVEFTDGSKTEYDLIIACDGIYSDVRERLFGNELQPEFTGQAVWRYNMPRPDDMEWGEIHAGPKSKVGLVPMKSDQMYMFVVSAEPGKPRFADDQLAIEMRKRLEGLEGKIRELGKYITDPKSVVYRPMENLVLPDPWYKGRTIVIGDGAHSTTPHLAQGAAMAIEDAVLLAELLGTDEPLEASLKQFMNRRFERAKSVVETSDQIAKWELEGWKGIVNPDARPGELLHAATLALQEDY